MLTRLTTNLTSYQGLIFCTKNEFLKLLVVWFDVEPEATELLLDLKDLKINISCYKLVHKT